MNARALSLCASVSLIALIVLCVVWETWIAPLRPGSMLALKAVPLLFPLRGVLHGRRYTSQWASMLALLYLTEGMLRFSDPGLIAVCARIEVVLALALFLSLVLHARSTAPSRRKND